MTLPSSGTLQASDINVELGRAWNHFFDMNGAAERNFAGKPSGTISFWDFYGKSNLIREPATGEYTDEDTYRWRIDTNIKKNMIRWGGVDIYSSPEQTYATSHVIGTWTYYRGAYSRKWLALEYYYIYRIGKY